MPTPAVTRSRIDGDLHRTLPASITILRSADPGAAGADGEDAPLRLRLSVSSETPYLRASWWDAPWIEILGHKPEEIDLSRLQNKAAVLANHDRYTPHGNTPLAGIGAVENAFIEKLRLVCDAVISRREALGDLRQDIADGLVNNVSIGYIINERVLTKTGENGQPDEYRVTSWTPFEISLVDVPADPTVGFGRSAAPEPDAKPGYRVVPIGTSSSNSIPAISFEGQRSMQAADTPNAPPAAPPAAAPAPAQARGAGDDYIAAERERVREITALGKKLNLGELAEKAIDSGVSLDAFRAQIVQRQVDTGALRAADSPEIGMSKKEVESYSFLRALLAAADPQQAHKIAPAELEASRAAQDKRGDSLDKTREAAITIPLDVLRRGIGLTAAEAASVARQMSGRAGGDAYRDLTAGTAGAGGNTVATELFGSSFIELLRNALVLDRMGVTMLRELNGNIAIPSQTGSASSYWVAESGAPTESQAAFGQVVMTPKTVGAYTDYSRRLLLQSSIDVEAFVRADLAAIISQALLLAAVSGTGSSNQPTGILNTSGIGSVGLGTNGAAPGYSDLVDLETAVAVANADVGNLAFLTNTKMRGKLRKTQVFSGTNGQPVWTNGRERGLGTVLGYDAYVTNAVPANLDKGTSTGVCSAAIFGNWADLMIGMWGGLDIMLDPYTGATSGTKRVVALQDVDIALRRVGSFAAIKDALTT